VAISSASRSVDASSGGGFIANVLHPEGWDKKWPCSKERGKLCNAMEFLYDDKMQGKVKVLATCHKCYKHSKHNSINLRGKMTDAKFKEQNPRVFTDHKAVREATTRHNAKLIVDEALLAYGPRHWQRDFGVRGLIKGAQITIFNNVRPRFLIRDETIDRIIDAIPGQIAGLGAQGTSILEQLIDNGDDLTKLSMRRLVYAVLKSMDLPDNVEDQVVDREVAAEKAMKTVFKWVRSELTEALVDLYMKAYPIDNSRATFSWP
jgi:hypothetical protein